MSMNRLFQDLDPDIVDRVVRAMNIIASDWEKHRDINDDKWLHAIRCLDVVLRIIRATEKEYHLSFQLYTDQLEHAVAQLQR